MTNETTKPNKMWTPPVGWFEAAQDARDTEAMFRELVKDNNSRIARGLPEFEPSYELAAQIIANAHK